MVNKGKIKLWRYKLCWVTKHTTFVMLGVRACDLCFPVTPLMLLMLCISSLRLVSVRKFNYSLKFNLREARCSWIGSWFPCYVKWLTQYLLLQTTLLFVLLIIPGALNANLIYCARAEVLWTRLIIYDEHFPVDITETRYGIFRTFICWVMIFRRFCCSERMH